MASPNEIWPGWETVRLIGSGSFGKVYEIKKIDDTGDFYSALKVISIPRSEDEYRFCEDGGYNEEETKAIFAVRPMSS